MTQESERSARRVSDDAGDPGDAAYRAIVEEQPDFVCRFLPDGTLSFANHAYCRYFGLRREDVVGTRYAPVVHPDDLPQVEALVASLSPANPVALIENRVYRADGEIRWTQWTNRALYDGQGRLVEFQSAGRDVTDVRRAAEDAARLAAIVNCAEVAILSMTTEGVVMSWNRSAERMFGYSAAEAVGQPMSIIVPADHAQETADILARLGAGETITHLETERLARDGRRIPVSLTISPIVDAGGRTIGISKILRDITERKQAERELAERESRFRLMADHAPVLIWIADTSNRGVYFNQPWIDFTGVPLEAQVGDGWLQLIHPDDAGPARAYCQSHFERRAPFTMEFRLRHRSGEYRWVQDTGQPLLLPDGTFNGYIGSCVDIHERKEAARLKDEFLAVVSHELRTPLNAILGWAHMLREGSLAGDDMPRALDTILRNARMQARLVDELLDASRIVTGNLSLHKAAVDLRGVVQAAAEAVRPDASAKGLVLETEAPGVSVAVDGDSARLQQAVANLLANAVKFTPAGGRVHVTVAVDAGVAVVTVRDSGCGIPAEALPFIFDRFRQADSRTTRSHGGLGLGLAIVAHIVEAHGGSVRAESAGPGLGATFELRLPVHPGGATEPPMPAAFHRADLAHVRALVVDDDPDARELIRAVLEQANATVWTAASVAEALEICRAVPPQLVIGDIGMAGRDGYELIRMVRRCPGLDSVPAIALTAYASPAHRDAAREAGYDLYLSKPVDPDAIRAAIEEICRAT